VTPQIDGDNAVWEKKVTPAIPRSGSPGTAAHRTAAEVAANGRDDVAPRLDGDHFVYESCLNLGLPDELCDVVIVPEPRATLGSPPRLRRSPSRVAFGAARDGAGAESAPPLRGKGRILMAT